MKRTLVAWLVGLTAVVGAGCGTICNFGGVVFHSDRDPRVYGGVQRDIEVIEGLTNGDTKMGKAAVFALAVMVIDPILSFAADTLTLPITLYVQHRREASYGSGNDALNQPNSATAGTPTSTTTALGDGR